jgi:LPXTG-motif cell wall-anchored protein
MSSTAQTPRLAAPMLERRRVLRGPYRSHHMDTNTLLVIVVLVLLLGGGGFFYRGRRV